MKLLISILIFISVSCGQKETKDYRSPDKSVNQKKVEQLEKDLLELQGVIAQINAFTSNDFADCSTNLSTFEQKICDIAQSATLEQRIEFSAQLAEMSKLYQNSIYGDDCINDSDVGCPVAGSILERVTAAESDIAAIDLTTIEADITALQSDVAALEGRLDNFDGSGSSIETVVNTIESDVNTLETRVDAIDSLLDSDRVPLMISLCSNIANSGPVYETAFLSGDRLVFNAWITVGGDSGIGTAKTYNDGDGDVYYATELNTRRCKFKVYETTANTDLKVCWNNTNRNANQTSINTVCDSANDFASPTAACTCK